jgi:hypothetical protein
MLAWILYMPIVDPWQLLGWILGGAAIALGWELVDALGRRSAPWQVGLGGAAGGALAFGALAMVRPGTPLPPLLRTSDPLFKGLQQEPWLSGLVVAIAALSGFAMGFGMATGATAGEHLWRRLSAGPEDRTRDHGSRSG